MLVVQVKSSELTLAEYILLPGRSKDSAAVLVPLSPFHGQMHT